MSDKLSTATLKQGVLFNKYQNKIIKNTIKKKYLKRNVSVVEGFDTSTNTNIAEVKNLQSELNTLLYQNSYFTDPQFSVKDLAQVLNIPNSHLQYIFKYHSKLSFSDYKKISRIQNSLELINNNYLATNTMESLSKAVGFSSYNPFFTCFKDVVGKSPHQYISSLSIKNDK